MTLWTLSEIAVGCAVIIGAIAFLVAYTLFLLSDDDEASQ